MYPEPKFQLFEKVNVILTGKVEGIDVSVKKEFFIMGIKYLLTGRLVGSFKYDLAESMELGNTTIARDERDLFK